jgi:hypothetical protein
MPRAVSARPALTKVATNRYEIGRLAAEIAVRINQPSIGAGTQVEMCDPAALKGIGLFRGRSTLRSLTDSQE